MGYLYALIYTIMTAYSGFVIAHATQKTDPFITMCCTFAICILFFNFTNLLQIKSTYTKLKKDVVNVLLLNVATMITWISSFIAFKQITPFVMVVLYMSIVPLTSELIVFLFNKKLNIKRVLFAIIIFILSGYAIYLNKSQTTTIINYEGVFLSYLAGIAFSFYMHFSKQAQMNLSLNPKQILSIRFYLITLVSLCYLLYRFDLTEVLQQINIINILLVTLTSTIIPLYLLQTSIHKIGPLKVSLIFAWTPIIIYTLQLYYGLTFHLNVFLLLVSLSLVLITSAITNR